MSLSTWLSFFAASWLISLSPGPGALSCMAAGLRYPYRIAVFNILGLMLGAVWLVSIVAVGLGAILATYPAWFTGLRWVGALYLVWLGVVQLRSPPKTTTALESQETTRGRLVLRAFLINATNPKGIVFLLAVLPQFIDPKAPQLPQVGLCMLSLLITDAVVMSGYTLLASRVLRTLGNPNQIRWMNRIFGGLFVVAGIFLAVLKHR